MELAELINLDEIAAANDALVADIERRDPLSIAGLLIDAFNQHC